MRLDKPGRVIGDTTANLLVLSIKIVIVYTIDGARWVLRADDCYDVLVLTTLPVIPLLCRS